MMKMQCVILLLVHETGAMLAGKFLSFPKTFKL